MGITVFVFDERAAVSQADYRDWIKREIKAAPKDAWNNPESSSPRLRKWFDDMRSLFPLIGDAHPDDSLGTEYCFYTNVIDVTFASSVGEEGILQAWKLADRHGLRLSVGDELLPREAPKTRCGLHIPVLHGRRRDALGMVPNVCFVIFDPDVANVAPSEARTWVLEQLDSALWSRDRTILEGDRLGRWVDLFVNRNLEGLISEMRFYRDLILVRVDKKDGSSMISPVMELTHKLNLPFEVYVDLG